MAQLTGALHVPLGPVWVAGLGARTPLGACAASTAAAVRAGLSALAEHPFFTDGQDEPVRLASDAFLSPDLPRAGRVPALLSAALEQLPLPRAAAPLVLVCLSEPDGEAALPCVPGSAVRAFWPGARVQLLAEGHAGAILALGVASRALKEGQAEVAIIAGVDSRQEGALLARLDAGGELKSEANRDGYFPGEAAGACLLATDAGLRRHGLVPQARLSGVATAQEPVTIRSTEGVCTGEGLSAALLALAPVVGKEGVTDIWCDLNGQRYRSEEWLYTVLRAQGLFADPVNCAHPADCWGDVGAATGPLLATLAVAAQAKGYSRGSRALLWASSEDGRRAAAILDALAGGGREKGV